MHAVPSKTAMSTAVARGRHRLYHDPPWILDDPFALLLVGPAWKAIEGRAAVHYPEPVARAYLGGIVCRSRYAEDRLVDGGFGQYVIRGAGLDSFVWRRPDLARSLTVFEVDHPASQAWKRQRAAELGLPEVASVTYVPVDFEADTLAAALDAAGLAWGHRVFFSWLGVTMYLTGHAIESTLQTVARCAPRSEVVLSYAPSDGLDDVGRQFGEIATPTVAAVGEPVVTRMSRSAAEDLVTSCRLDVADHPDRDVLVARYFAARADGLRPYSAERLLAARVPPGRRAAPTT